MSFSRWLVYQFYLCFTRHACVGKAEGNIMTEYIVGLRRGDRSQALTIEAEDALIAALKVKHNHPEAMISYVRKSNQRGDRRNPHRKE
jgi:hypothetical protein